MHSRKFMLITALLVYASLMSYFAYSAAGFPTCDASDFLGKTCSTECAPGLYHSQLCTCNPCPTSEGSGPFERKVYHCLVNEFKVCPKVVVTAGKPTEKEPGDVARDSIALNATLSDMNSSHIGSARPANKARAFISPNATRSDNSSSHIGSASTDSNTTFSNPGVNGSSPSKSFADLDSKDPSYAVKLSVGLPIGFAVLGCVIGLAVWLRRTGCRDTGKQNSDPLLQDCRTDQQGGHVQAFNGPECLPQGIRETL